jgi:hypothetical protein
MRVSRATARCGDLQQTLQAAAANPGDRVVGAFGDATGQKATAGITGAGL